MARKALPLSRYEAHMVIVPACEDEPRVLDAVRVVVFGSNFPQRAIEPELLVGDEIARWTSIARDQQSLHGYFLHMPAEDAPIRVRYGDSLEGVLDERFARKRVRPLPKHCEN